MIEVNLKNEIFESNDPSRRTSSPASMVAAALAAAGAEADPESDDEDDDEDGGEDGDAARPPDGRHLAGDGGAQVVEVVLHPLKGNHVCLRSLTFL